MFASTSNIHLHFLINTKHRLYKTETYLEYIFCFSDTVVAAQFWAYSLDETSTINGIKWKY